MGVTDFIRSSRAFKSQKLRWRVLVGTSLLFPAAGCVERYPLGDVPVIGGSKAQQAEVRAELDRLEAVMNYPPVLSKVEITSVRDAVANYRARDDRVRISALLPADDVATALRHEVCHALFEQTTTPALARALSEDVVERAGWLDTTAERKVESEAFAVACGWGETGLRAMATECAGSAERYLVAAASLIGPFAYKSVSGDATVPVRDLELALPDASVVESLLGSEDGIATFGQPGSLPQIWVDIYSEQVVDHNRSAPTIWPNHVKANELHLHGAVLTSGVQDSGRGMALVRPEGAIVPRLVGRDGSGSPWLPARCASSQTTVIGVLVDERIWFVESGEGQSPSTYEAF